MSLNKVKSKGYIFPLLTHTWNPLGGQCTNFCKYCSTEKLRKRFPLMRDRYSDNMRALPNQFMNFGKPGKFIFVVAKNDLFANGVHDSTISRILTHCNINKGHKYLFQTRNIERFQDWYFEGLIPENSVLCTTIETNRIDTSISKAPDTADRAFDMFLLKDEIDCYVTIEPIMDFDFIDFVRMIKQIEPKQVNIGADSRPEKLRDLPEPSKEKILQLISELEKFTVVKQKSNLKRLLV